MNPPGATPARRKADHLRIAAADDVQHREGTGLDRVRLRHRALPGRDLAEVDLRATVLGRALRAPLLVSAMTGGTDEAEVINGRLIRAAADHGIGLVLGSGRRLLDEPAPQHHHDLIFGADRLGVVALHPTAQRLDVARVEIGQVDLPCRRLGG